MEEGAKGKKEFTREFGKDYGYPDGPRRIDEIRASEFKRLNGLVYLDHAGASLYSESQMEATFRDLTTNVYGNPHSQSDASMESLCIIQAARQQVLEFINAPAKDYSCIFTSGATAALKLLGEAFPWCSGSCFMYTMENHNSVLGIREYALNKGATAVVVDVEQIEEHSGPSNLSFKKLTSIPQRQSGANLSGEAVDRTVYNLFAFPSECNFSGRRFDLELVNVIKEDSSKLLRGSLQCSGCWKVLIDAAKGCATQPPDLTRYPADFVVISFYKIFGYPTGLGALVVKREAAALLEKAYFSGGTVVASISDLDYVKRRKNIEDLFEDGTQSFLGIASLRHGFKLINMLSLPSVERHTSTLNAYVRKALLAMRHENGSVVCVLYGLNDAKGQGPTIAFNLKRPDGTWYGYREVEKLASLSGIQLRTGCFCNPGACAKYLGLSHSELFSNIEAGHVCWDDYDVLHGKPTGAVRISFGYMSTFEDAKKFIDFIEKAFVSKESPSTNGSHLEVDVILSSSGIKSMLPRRELYLKTINIFPIKSCSGFSAESWPLSATGLLHDREWCLQSPSGEVLTQKKVPRMSLVGPLIDRTRGLLTVESPYCSEKLQIGLDISCKYLTRQKMNLHAQRYEFQVYNDEINQWFSEAIGCPCTLVRCCSSEVLPCTNGRTASTCRDTDSKLNFVNEAQFLLVTEESVDDLNRRLMPNCERYESDTLLLPIDPIRFRPNLVIGGAEPYEEDDWKAIHIDKEHFSVIGGCNRCQMINRNPKSISMQLAKEPLATLSSYRRVKGKILFGILLRHNRRSYPIETKSIAESDVLMPMLQVGARVYPRTD